MKNIGNYVWWRILTRLFVCPFTYDVWTSDHYTVYFDRYNMVLSITPQLKQIKIFKDISQCLSLMFSDVLLFTCHFHWVFCYAPRGLPQSFLISLLVILESFLECLSRSFSWSPWVNWVLLLFALGQPVCLSARLIMLGVLVQHSPPPLIWSLQKVGTRALCISYKTTPQMTHIAFQIWKREEKLEQSKYPSTRNG